MCCLLVSGFLGEITQQIHSLRASGVMSSHFARATASAMRAFFKSAGTLCTVPGEITFLAMDFNLPLYRYSWALRAACMRFAASSRRQLPIFLIAPSGVCNVPSLLMSKSYEKGVNDPAL